MSIPSSETKDVFLLTFSLFGGEVSTNFTFFLDFDFLGAGDLTTSDLVSFWPCWTADLVIRREGSTFVSETAIFFYESLYVEGQICHEIKNVI